jgi:hypothetical protein
MINPAPPALAHQLPLTSRCSISARILNRKLFESPNIRTLSMTIHRDRHWIGLLTLCAIVLFLPGCLSHCKSNENPCGSMCYDNRSQSCCNNQVYQGTKWQGCDDVCYRPDSQICCNGSVGDSSSQFCCAGKIRDKKDWSVCGDSCFRTSNQFCCNGTAQPNGKGLAECGGICYDTSSRKCCNGSVYDPQKQSCCNGQIYVKSSRYSEWLECGDMCYDSGTRGCCGDKFVYDSKTEACCGGTPIPTDLLMCCSGKHAYIQATQSCCGDVVLDGLKRCCKFYNDTKWTICPAGLQCCADYQIGPTCYDPRYYECKIVTHTNPLPTI